MFFLCITKELKSKLTDLLHFDFVDILFNLLIKQLILNNL